MKFIYPPEKRSLLWSWPGFQQKVKSLLQSHINDAPINVNHREGGRGFRANHGSFIVKSVPMVGILIVCDVHRLAILIVQRTFHHLHLPPGGHFDQLFCPRDGEFESF